MFGLFWELHQNNQINSASIDATQAKYAANDAANKSHDLEYALHRMLLINRAMWELMRERLNLTEEELMQKVSDIETRESSQSGNEPVKCAKCGRVTHQRHGRCIYCGATMEKSDVFDTVK